MQPRILITGTDSGVGKTTVTLGLMAAFAKQNKRVQGFKCGPDYIDPTFHEVITKRPSYQLDTWMTSCEWVKETFVKKSEDADLSIIEGMMGFYDGRSPLSNEGSTYEISQILDSPCLLIININGSARSAAAMVKGYQELESGTNIVGVILNQAGSEGHAKLCKDAIQQMCHIPVVGYLKRGDTPILPERQLGLIPALKQGEYDSFIDELSVTISKQFDLDLIWRLAIQTHPVKHDDCWLNLKEQPRSLVQIAVAYDEAFHFYYDENLRLLQAAGAKLTYFSPLKGEGLPNGCDGVYLGGGFPEEYAKELSLNKELFQQLRKAANDQMPILAECGGYILLGESLTLTNGVTYPMACVTLMHFQMNKSLTAIGYREVTSIESTILGEKGTILRGHEFHYSSSSQNEGDKSCFKYKTWNGKEKQQGYFNESVIASYVHLHFASYPEVAKNWVKACCAYKEKRIHLMN
ncbi:cobyrinate a,c-diamide synthase [Alkalihalophilus sp. As8PL]|uniref:Cobyrinate a,c-diamide synthase n=1 Tax=Alkalihalophilus sp. As8PL TaxID=3237103 RepID=A0AB39BSG1_9BACI